MTVRSLNLRGIKVSQVRSFLAGTRRVVKFLDKECAGAVIEHDRPVVARHTGRWELGGEMRRRVVWW